MAVAAHPPKPATDLDNDLGIPEHGAYWYWRGFYDAQLPEVKKLARAAKSLLEEHAHGETVTPETVRSLLADLRSRRDNR